MSALPEGTTSLQAPDGSTYTLDGSGIIRIEADADRETIELIALDEEGTPLGTYAVLTERETIPNDARPLSTWLWILGGVILAGGIGAAGYFLWRKGKTIV